MEASVEPDDRTFARRLAGCQLADDAIAESWRAHIYQPLKPERRQIRVLRLFPSGDLEADPEGVLWNLDLADVAESSAQYLPPGQLFSSSESKRGTFSALSYTWGNGKERRAMILDGRLIRIGRNAHDALRYLRKAKAGIDIWIDAICIDQADVQERSQQVALMKEIYSLARPVYIWTGQADKPVWIAFNVLFRMALVAGETDSHGDPEHFAKKRAVWTAMQQVPDADWKNLAAFLHLPIWTRVWIQQEIILSSPVRKMALVVAGKRDMNHHIFHSATRIIGAAWDTFSGPDFVEAPGISVHPMKSAAKKAIALCFLLNSWAVHQSIPAEFLFSIMRYMEAKDPKDYVYGLLGLLPCLAKSPDYTKSIAEVYTEAMFNILHHKGLLDPILGWNRQWDCGKDNVPSWVRDWRERTNKNYRESWSSLDVAYNACNGYPMLVTLDEYRLQVVGYLLFVIHENDLGPSTEFNYQTLKPPAMQRTFASARLGFLDFPERETILSFDQRFERTLLLDLDLETSEGKPRRLGSTTVNSLTTTARQIIRGQLTGPVGSGQVCDRVFQKLSDRLRDTRIAVSPERQMCVLPRKTRGGDVACILAGCNVPFVLRPASKDVGPAHYHVIGGAYIEGVMDGEATIGAAKSRSEGGQKDAGNIFHHLRLV